jgi:hypothetical protein
MNLGADLCVGNTATMIRKIPSPIMPNPARTVGCNKEFQYCPSFVTRQSDGVADRENPIRKSTLPNKREPIRNSQLTSFMDSFVIYTFLPFNAFFSEIIE